MKYKVGDKVRLVDDTYGSLFQGRIGTIKRLEAWWDVYRVEFPPLGAGPHQVLAVTLALIDSEIELVQEGT